MTTPTSRFAPPAATLSAPSARARATRGGPGSRGSRGGCGGGVWLIVGRSPEQPLEHLVDRLDADDLDGAGAALRDAPLRHVGAGHPHLRRLGEPALGLRDGPDLAAEADLAEEDGVVGEGAV